MKWVLVFLLLAQSVLGATIYGTVYDFGLDRVDDSIVEINTSPRQQMVAKNGSYSFNVEEGSYAIKARFVDDFVIEEINVSGDGSFVLDLILFPDFEEDVFEEDFLIDEPITERSKYSWFVWIIVFLALGYIVYLVSRKPKVERVVEKVTSVKEVVVAEDIEQIISFIDEQGGRTTQKDIRKNFPYSEAKISLMIDELEEKGLVKRIKKGRGNIIVRR